jgi:hypothetical protein
MAHFAQLDENNNVIQIDVVANSVINDLPFPESEPIGIEFLKSIYGENTRWVQTSYNSNFRNTYAMIGSFYDSVVDAFVPASPFPSWVRTEHGLSWEAPVQVPDYVNGYEWDESIVNWVLVEENTREPTQI